MKAILYFILFLSMTSLAGCSKDTREDLIVGRWELVKYFINDIDQSVDCRDKSIMNFTEERTLYAEVTDDTCKRVLPFRNLFEYRFTDKNNTQNIDLISVATGTIFTFEILLISPEEFEIQRVENQFTIRYIFEKL